MACLEGYQRMICKTDIPGTLLHEPPKVQGYVEQEYRQNKKFYEALLSETEAFAEVDIETEELMAAGGLWKSYKENAARMVLPFVRYWKSIWRRTSRQRKESAARSLSKKNSVTEER